MKLINPFDRLKKRNSVPLSLFPASKKTATTMQVGRATPLYCIDMVQGNRLKLSVEQLTRLMEMNGPLMQNYEVTFGAYFVPYVALDHFFDSAWFQKNVSGSQSKYLKARDFFNPATPDSLRVKCASITPADMPFGNGSLWQHLGYPTVPLYTSFNYMATYVPWNDESTETAEGEDLYDLCSDKLFDASDVQLRPVSDAPYQGGFSNFITYLASISPVMLPNVGPTTKFRNSVAKVCYGYESDDAPYTYKDMFGNRSWSGLQLAYIKFLNSQIADTYQNKSVWSDYVPDYFGTEVNLYRWLAYLRIYSDWYLNPIYTAEEDFRDVVGQVYLGIESGKSIAQSVAAATKLTADSTLNFFANYIKSGECFPVLWKKDQLTSIVQTDAASSVAIGSTIGENFYNRMYAKFKDLVARMGRDYRQNTKALYGSPVGDNSLQRSQVIGYKSFTVQVGEVAQTSQTTDDSNLGQFVGYAMSRDKAGLFDWTAEENGMVMVIAYVRPVYTAIAGQIDKSLYKFDYLDYLIPEFGGVGYQPVKANRFDYTQDDTTTLGLEERYAEYMSVPSEVSGDMLDVYSYLTSDRIFPQLYQFGTQQFYHNLYMSDTEALHRVFQNSMYDPIALVAFFNGSVTRQLPATIRTDF